MNKKYTIGEGKLKEVIMNHFDSYFDVKNLESYTSDDEPNYASINNIKNDDVVIRWHDKEYFTNPDSKFGKLAPVVSIENEYIDPLDSMFGNLWKPIFKEWFEKNFNLPVNFVG
jgi:hypothetical protein